MDCRKGWWLGLGLLIGGIGCKTQQMTPNPALVTPAGQPVAMEVTKEKDLPKRDPSPALLVAYGDFQEREAQDRSHTPVEQEQYHDRARRAYQKALDKEPANVAALQALAHLYAAIQDHDRAIATYQRAVNAHPKDAALWFDMGVYQTRCKEWDPAAQNLRQALALDPENRFYANWLGNCLARAGHYDESVICFEKAVGPAQARYNVARMQLHMNQEEAARQNLRLAVQADPRLEEARSLLAKLEGAGVQQAGYQVASPNQAAPGSSPVKIGLED
jgi:tetratricopeptide (TPR) repeat protein